MPPEPLGLRVINMTTYSNMEHEDSDSAHYVITYAQGCLKALPWGDAKFDCLLFKFEDDYLMQQAIDELLAKNCNRIHTAGEDPKYWRAYIDQRSVDLGRQSAVGDGNPRTEWHEEVNLLNLRDNIQSGGSDYFLVVLVGLKEIQYVVEASMKKTQDKFNKAVKGFGVKRPMPPGENRP
jgi:hypothetical protein